MKHMVSYKLRADQVDENERLVKSVFEARHRTRPPGLRYTTLKQADGVSFVHLVAHDEPDAVNALTSLPEFKEFAAGVKERCAVPPVRVELTVVGADGFFGE